MSRTDQWAPALKYLNETDPLTFPFELSSICKPSSFSSFSSILSISDFECLLDVMLDVVLEIDDFRDNCWLVPSRFSSEFSTKPTRWTKSTPLLAKSSGDPWISIFPYKFWTNRLDSFCCLSTEKTLQSEIHTSFKITSQSASLRKCTWWVTKIRVLFSRAK